MESDDTQTILKWKALRESLLEPKIAEHGGQLLQVMGDGVFVEFDSVVSAVRWAHDVQRAIVQSAVEGDRDSLQVRIGRRGRSPSTADCTIARCTSCAHRTADTTLSNSTK